MFHSKYSPCSTQSLGGLRRILNRAGKASLGECSFLIVRLAGEQLYLMIVLNIVPLIYFVIILWCLGSGSWTGISHWNLKAAWKSLLSTIPALAPFGFYRIWTGFVEFSSQLFYGVSWPWNTNNPPQALTDFGIHLDPSDLNPNFACGNFMWGLIYVGVGLIIALIGIFF